MIKWRKVLACATPELAIVSDGIMPMVNSLSMVFMRPPVRVG